eukprot:10355344-Ditylum_brightwellii.AAC.1
MASLLVGRLAAIAIRFLITRVADDAHDAVVALGEGDVVEDAHRVHVVVALLDRFIDLVLDERVQ